MLMKSFNRKVAVYVGLLVLSFDVFLCYIQYPVGFIRFLSFFVNIPGVIHISVLGVFAPHLTSFEWMFVYIVIFALSAAFWSVVFGFIFSHKLPPKAR
jgi:hypothetical protein